MYNYYIEVAVLYHTQHFFVKKGFATMEDSDLNALREMIMQATNECSDPDFLDFIYKLIISETE